MSSEEYRKVYNLKTKQDQSQDKTKRNNTAVNMAPQTNIDLYTSGTPNGQKISITLEELGLNYNVHKIDIANNVQKEGWYLKINPNGRIPAIVDNTTTDSPQRIFEGAAIQLYLTTKYDSSYKLSFPHDTPEYYQVLEWLVWMQSGLGPMQGQANHFYRYAPTKIPYAIERYQTETKRLYQVLNDRLAEQAEQFGSSSDDGNAWIVGNKYTIADICCFSWVNWAEWAGVETRGFGALQAWLEAIQKRAAVVRGCDVPEKFEMKSAMQSKEGEEAFAKHHSGWVMKGQEEDQKRHKEGGA